MKPVRHYQSNKKDNEVGNKIIDRQLAQLKLSVGRWALVFCVSFTFLSLIALPLVAIFAREYLGAVITAIAGAGTGWFAVLKCLK